MKTKIVNRVLDNKHKGWCKKWVYFKFLDCLKV